LCVATELLLAISGRKEKPENSDSPETGHATACKTRPQQTQAALCRQTLAGHLIIFNGKIETSNHRISKKDSSNTGRKFSAPRYAA